MKGVVFVALADMIQSRYGYKYWNEVVTESKVESNGIYTSAESYDDKEVFQLIDVLTFKMKEKSENVLKLFGLYLLKYYSSRYPQYFENKNLEEFLSSINDLHRLEIKKLTPDSRPPVVVVNKFDEKLEIIYKSDRKLCSLAFGLIKGASHFFNEPIELKECNCMKHGHSECVFELTYKKVA